MRLGPAAAVATAAPLSAATITAEAGTPVPSREDAVVPTAGAEEGSAESALGDVAALMAAADWRGVIRALGLGGMTRELAQHCEWLGFDEGGLGLRLSHTHRHLLDVNRNAVERMQEQLGAALGHPLKISVVLGEIAGETPAQRDEAERRVRHAEAVAALESDPFVRELIERFDATLVEASVRPI